MAFKALDVNGNDIPNAKKRTSKDIFTLEEQIKNKTKELEEEGKYLTSAGQQLQKYGTDANDFALLTKMADNEKDFNDAKSRYETAKKGYDSIVDEYTKRQRDYTNKFQGLQYDLRDYEDVMKNMTASEWDKVAEHEDRRITGSYTSPFANALWDKPSYEEFADREQMVAVAQQNAAYARRMADSKRDEEWQNEFNSKHFETLPNFAVDSMYDHKYDDDDFYYMVNNPEMYGTSNTDSNRGGGKSFSGTDKDDRFTRIFGPNYVYNRETLTDNEKALFNYIYKTQGRDKAMEFFDTIPEEVLNYRSARREAENNEAFGYENLLMANIKSVASNLFKPVTYAASLLDIGKDGKYTRNAWYNVPTIDTEGLTKGVVQKINDVTDDFIHQQITDELMEKYGSVSQEMVDKIDENINYGFIHNAENFGYQTMLSMENFLVNTKLANVIGGSVGLSQAATNWLDLGMMGSGAALDATKKSLDRGMTDGQSFLLGAIAGLAEVATEKVSIEALFSPKTGIKYVLDNFISEGSEEVASDLINWAADVTIGQGASEWADSVREHNGDIGAAFQEKLLDSALSFLGGAISGGIMGGVSQGIADIRAEKFGKMIKDMGMDGIEYIQSLIEDGKNSSNKQIKKIAEALDSQLKESGIDIENLDNKSIGRLNQLFLIEEENAKPVAEEPTEAKETVIEDGIPQTFAAPLTDEEAIARLKEEGIDMNNVGNLTRTILPKETNNDIRGSERSIAENDGRTSEQSSEWGTQAERAVRRRSLPNSGESKTASSVFRIQKAEGEISYISNKTAKSDPELAEILSKAKTDGAKVKFYRGTAKVGNKLIFGNYNEKTGVINVQIDSDTRTAMATYEHEKVHLKSVQNKSIVSDFLDSIRGTEEFSAVMSAYKDTYSFQRGKKTESEFELWVAEEILADAEAGIDKGGAATAYAEIAHQILDTETTESSSAETVEAETTEAKEEPKTRGPPQTLQESAQAQLDKSAPKTETKPAPKAETVQKSAQKQIDRKTETKKTEKPKGFAINKTLLNGFESFIKEHNNGKYEINGVKLAQPRTLFSDPDAIIEVFKAITKYENSEMMGTLLADRYEQISGETFPMDGFEQLQDEYGENEAYAAPLANATVDENGNETHFSVESSVRAAGFNYTENQDGSISVQIGLQTFREGEITANLLSHTDSSLKLVLDMAESKGTMLPSEVTAIYKKYADYLNVALSYLNKENGTSLMDAVWRWKVSDGDVFKATKKNSDKQYNTSIDMLTICKKTEQLMLSVSDMQKKLKRGLTPSEMFECYLQTGSTKNPETGRYFQTPCPICYVFSHWIDNGKNLNTVWSAQKKYADKFGKWTADQWYAEYNKQKAFAEKNKDAISKAKEVISESMILTDTLATKYDAADDAGKETIKKLIASQSKAYTAAVKLLSECDYAAWIKNNAITISANDGVTKVSLRDDFRTIDSDTLFDMYKVSEVAKEYPNVARFKASKGSDAGKQVETETNNEFGSVVEGIAKHGERDKISDILKNYNTASETEKAKIKKEFEKQFDKAVNFAKRQTLIGGQRLFSWSDNRIEFGPDMFMNFIQLQAIGSSVQSYSKQLEGLELIAAMGGYVNGSLLAKGRGYDDNGNLVFSDIQGINASETFKLNNKYSKAGNILVGMNDKHIAIALADDRIFFVIPYHKSGLRATFLARMMEMLGEPSLEEATDYSAFQEEKTLVEKDEEGNPIGEYTIDMNGVKHAVTDEQKAYRELRSKIILSGTLSDLQLMNDLTAEQRRVFQNDEYLQQIREKTRGIEMTEDDTKSIYPYEYWDESSTYANADINGKRYLELCDRLGLQPKFSGVAKGKYQNKVNKKTVKVAKADFRGLKGYWKLLVDRRMYDINGKYQGTTTVQANDFTNDLIDPVEINKKYPVTTPANASMASTIADKAIASAQSKGYDLDIEVNPTEASQQEAVDNFLSTMEDAKFENTKKFKQFEKEQEKAQKQKSKQTRASVEPQNDIRDDTETYRKYSAIKNPGVNINNRFGDVDSIKAGAKSMETRTTRNLDAFIGKRIALIETGSGKAKIFGYATVNAPSVMSRDNFDDYYDEHRVGEDNGYYPDGRSTNNYKYGYRLSNIKLVDPIEIGSDYRVDYTVRDLPFNEKGSESTAKRESMRFSTEVLMGSEFSGAGLLESGLVYKMLKNEFGVEYDNNIAAIYRDNHGTKIYAGPEEGNVFNFDISKHKNLFYLHASPVCHDYSIAKHGRAELAQDLDSARKVASDLETAQPPVFTVENAPAYLDSEALKIITDKLDELGYKWSAKIYNAADYGAATSRERCILLATKDGSLPSDPQKVPRTNSWDKVTRYTWDSLKPAESRQGTPFPNFLLDAMRNTKKLRSIFNDDGTITVDRPLLVITTTSGHEVTFAWEGQLCPTLTTKCGEGRLILPGENISLETPNENILAVTPQFMGSIQGLPADFKYGKFKSKAFQVIGNGIPVDLTRAVIGNLLESAYEQTYGEELEKGIRFSVTPVDPVQPSEGSNWERTHTTDEAMKIAAEHGIEMWNVAEESEEKNPTSMTNAKNETAGTSSTYAKAFRYLGDGYDGRILDASSGMGYGTRIGRENYGLDITDIEPYADPKNYQRLDNNEETRHPMYEDYSELDRLVQNGEVEPFDFIISNAVLNVIPQDQRDGLVTHMGHMLAPGGQMFINVRGADEIRKLASNPKNAKLGDHEAVESVHGSYQYGFVKSKKQGIHELKDYVQDVLGSDYTVEDIDDVDGFEKVGSPAVMVTKSTDASRFSAEEDPEATSLRDFADGIRRNAPKEELYKLWRKYDFYNNMEEASAQLVVDDGPSDLNGILSDNERFERDVAKVKAMSPTEIENQIKAINEDSSEEDSAEEESAEEESKANQLISDYGIKIAKPIVSDYSNYEALMANDRAARDVARRIKAVDKIFPLSSTEKTIARRMASGKIDEAYVQSNYPGVFNIPKKKDAVLQLAELYREQDTYADHTIDSERSYTNLWAAQHASEWFASTGEENLKALKNIKMMNSNTPKRMCRTIWGSERGENIYNEFFRPVGKNEANRMRWVNKMYDRVKSIGKLTTEESAVVQKLLEGIDLDGNEKFRKDRVDKAVETLRQTYSDLYDIINAFLTTHGIQPIGFIRDYAPHAQPESVARGLDAALLKAGVFASDLPTSISGRTSQFKPRHKFVRNFLTRTGNQTIYDAVNGYQDYINSVSEVIFHTDDIIRTRGIVNYLRSTYSPQNQQDIIATAKELIRSKNLEEKNEFIVEHDLFDGPVDSTSEANNLLNGYIAKILETKEESNNNTKYSEFVKWVDNYANIIAGKQNFADRALEYQKGRKQLNFGNRLFNLFRTANVSGNISSVLNQTAQLPMILSELGFRNDVSVIKSLFKGDLRMTRKNSDFLTGKGGVDFIVKTIPEMINNFSFIGAEFVDSMISTIAVQGKLNEQIRKGKDYDEAMEIADEFARDIMGSRLKGEKPLRFTEKDWKSQIINMYQIEAANTWNHVAKDLPNDFKRIKKDKGVAAAVASLIGVIFKTLITSFALNRVAEELYGGTPSPGDIFGLTANFIASGHELTANDLIRTLFDDASESLGGERFFETEKLDDQFDMVNAIGNTIFNISNDIPYVRNYAGLLGLGDQTIGMPMVAQGNDIYKAIMNGKFDEIPESFLELIPSLIPYGRQLTKTAKGLNEYFQGGAYTASGKLKYPVEHNIPTLFQNALFGPYANKDASRYYAQRNPQALSDKRTTVYQKYLEQGYSNEEAYELAQNAGKKEETEDFLTSTERELLDNTISALNDKYLDLETLKSNVPKWEKYKAIIDLGFDADKTSQALKSDGGMGANDYRAYVALTENNGYTPAEAIEHMQEVAEAKPQKETTLTDVQKTSVDDKIEKLKRQYLDPETLRSTVPKSELMQAVVDLGLSDEETIGAFEDISDISQYGEKARVCYEYDVSPQTYVDFHRALKEHDSDGNGSYTNEEVFTAIDSMPISNTQKAALWQTYNKSATRYGNKNPFDTRIGELIYAEMHPEQ